MNVLVQQLETLAIASEMPRIFMHDYAGHAFSIELARALARAGYDVFYVYFAATTHTPKGKLLRQPHDPTKLQIVGVDSKTRFKKDTLLGRRTQDLKFAREVAEHLEKFKPDVVISACAPPEVHLLLAKVSARIGARFVYWVEDLWSIGARVELQGRLPLLAPLASFVLERMERRLVVESDANIVICPAFLEVLIAWGADPAKCHVIPNWASIEDLPLLPKDNLWAREHGLHGKFCVLYSGSLGLKHNPDMLAELASAMRLRRDLRIVVISEGSGARALADRKCADDLENLILLPYQPFDRFAEVLATGDVLVAMLEADASVYCVPSKVLAYLCSGRAQLLSVPECNYSAQIVAEAGAGRFSTPGDINAFIAHASALIENPEECRLRGEAGRSFAERQFSITRIVAQFEEVIASVLDNPASKDRAATAAVANAL